MAAEKIIVTNTSALQAKYGKGHARVSAALDKLMAADRKRGLNVKLVALDSAADMAACGGRAVAAVADQQATKAAIDAVWRQHKPEYLMILGAPDVVVQQHLVNPVFDPNGDDDQSVPSDLPYACEAGYSTNPMAFLGPTRVVGRLPDLVGVADPAYLVSLLGTAARWKSRPRADYQRYFAISAEVWRGSTALSCTKLFGSTADLALSPPKGPAWTPTQLGRRVHFINCHGGASDPKFYGQKGRSYPVAHEAARLKRKVANGTVVAAECCYGGQLYDPNDSDGQAGICSTYLGDGAYGFFGSSTIAYGPSEGNGQADLICQFFMEAVLDGASQGRAALEARHRYASNDAHLDPTDLKTLAQFYLLGDPSVAPVIAAKPALTRSKVFKAAMKDGGAGTRALRRERLVRTGASLAATLGGANVKKGEVPDAIQKVLKDVARETGIDSHGFRAFELNFPDDALAERMKAAGFARKGRSIYMLTGTRKGAKDAPGRYVALVATVQDGKLIRLSRVHSR